MYSTPFIINENLGTEPLKRLPLDSGFNEQWLQTRLFENPQSLPFAEIDPAYQSVCPLCMEMNTGAGPIDIVYVTPQGRLVIVETKLWRNPEARRKVVGQILDYAKELKQWSYADLQREVSRRTKIKGNSPYKILQEQFPDVDEAAFVDGVTQSLQRGDFMLVIAGDGIRKDAQGIVQFLEDVGNMRFVLALIEVAVYKHTVKEMYLIQPRTLAKTQQINREIDYSAESLPQSASLESENGKEEWRKQYKEFWSEFLKDLILDDPDQPIANPVSIGNITFSLPPSGGIAWLTTYLSKQNKTVGCFIRLINKPMGQELFQALAEEKDSINADLPFEVVWKEDDRLIERHMKVTSENWPPNKDSIVEEFLSETINGMINTFRPRLERLSGN